MHGQQNIKTCYIASQYTCIYIHSTQVLAQCSKTRSTFVVRPLDSDMYMSYDWGSPRESFHQQ